MYAATPATCGQAIEVPDIIEYFTCLSSLLSSDGELKGEYAARISTPGADTSGCNPSNNHCLSGQEIKKKGSRA
ncbi:unnamed protein product [Arabidopsis halleri]